MQQVKKPKRPLYIYYLIALAVLILLNALIFPKFMGQSVETVDYGTFLKMVENQKVSKVQIENENIYFTDKSKEPKYYETTTFDDPELVDRLYDSGCSFGRVVKEEMNPILSLSLIHI